MLAPPVTPQRRWLTLLVVALAALPLITHAQPKASATDLAASAPVRMEGRTLDGQAFSLERHRGKVVMLVFWSTGCAVCRDRMPELRANYAGWHGKPFELVTVAVDAKRQDVLDYDRVIERIVPMKERFPSLWRPEQGYADSLGTDVGTLPASFILDREGRVAERFNGRMPAEAWDRVADLMP